MTAEQSPYRPDLMLNQKVLVTGGGTGLGREMALHYAKHGADVALFSRKRENLDAVAKEIEALGRQSLVLVGDIREPEAVEAAVHELKENWGRLDVLVNNSAGNFLCPVEDMSENAWRAVLGIVLDGTWRMSKLCLPLLEESQGKVLNIVTTYAELAAPLVAHSGAAKAGVLNLTRSLAVEWGIKGIRVNAIAPGPIPTEGAFSRLVMMEGAEERLKQSIPLGRFGNGTDLGNTALFLTSDASAWITGEVVYMDGGQWLNHPMFELGH